MSHWLTGLCVQTKRSRQGKMEKSFLSFAATYSTWEPDAAAKQMLASLNMQSGPHLHGLPDHAPHLLGDFPSPILVFIPVMKRRPLGGPVPLPQGPLSSHLLSHLSIIGSSSQKSPEAQSQSSSQRSQGAHVAPSLRVNCSHSQICWLLGCLVREHDMEHAVVCRTKSSSSCLNAVHFVFHTNVLTTPVTWIPSRSWQV